MKSIKTYRKRIIVMAILLTILIRKLKFTKKHQLKRTIKIDVLNETLLF